MQTQSVCCFVRAMVPSLFVFFILETLASVQKVCEEPQPETYTYAFESMVVVIFALAGFNCYLLLSHSPSQRKIASHTDAAVQCDLHERFQPEHDTPAGAIFFSPHGARWHAKKDCRQLRHALKSTQLTPCQTCSG